MGLNENQLRAVKASAKPLFIQAGAGTGKTFTLTKRLAYGLGEQSGPLIEDVDRLLTITFTNKAAGELLGRVRAELRAQGLDEAALKVDAAWISTIHAMCQNILRLHALEAKVDAGAGMLSEEESSALLEQAFDEMVREGVAASDPDLAVLLSRYGPDATRDMVVDLACNKLQLASQGAASFHVGPAPSGAGPLVLADVLGCVRAGIDALRQLGAPDTQACQRAFDKLQQAAAILDEGLADPAAMTTWTAIAAVLERCPVAKGGNVKKLYRPLFAQVHDAVLDAQLRAVVGSAHECLGAALRLADSLLGRHRRLKRACGSLDMGDLLIETYRLFERHPHIAARYRQRFASVMVDEFQDTDALQVEIVKRLCDEGLSTLATVGDAQQSIYGFRGADLEVYRSVRAEMRSLGAVEVDLDTNYRSHPHVLGFVESIFSTREFFGSEFLRVKPGPDNVRSCPWHETGSSARVQVLLQAGCKDPDNPRRRTGVDALRRADAQAVAQRFESFARAGASYGDMAVLMRSTAHAQPYLDALRERGIPCVVSGGSTFYALPEVAMLASFLRVLENRDDDEALYELLGSRFFDATDTDLLALAVVGKQVLQTVPDSPKPRPSLFDALAYLATHEGLEQLGIDPPSALLLRAHQVLERAFRRVGAMPLSSVVAAASRESGLHATLQAQGAQGMAQAANIDRFCDLLDEYEATHGADVLGAAEHFRKMCDSAGQGRGARGKPGTMVAFGSDAVQIMTMHASKGLEFPIVAVAEFESAARSQSARAVSLTEQGVSYLALPAGGSAALKARLDDIGESVDSFAGARSAETFAAYARQLNGQRVKEEQQRLLYVALTRARDTLLLVAHDATYASTGELPRGLFADVAAALFPEGLPASGSAVKTATGALVSFEVTEVPCGRDATVQEGRRGAFDVCEHLLEQLPEPPRVQTRIARQRTVFSYSSLAQAGSGDAQASSRLRERTAGTVSSVGSAFHAVAQWLVERFPAPPDAVARRCEAAARRYGLDAAGTRRLRAAVDAWTASSRHASVQAFPQVQAEYAFCVELEDVLLEGYIDVLCLDSEAGAALVVDYKTGTSGSSEELAERYRLQAACYAYAVLASGLAKRVELAFVRPEAAMEEVAFEFTEHELPELAADIATHVAESRRR